VCGRAGTDKLRSALKSTSPLFIVNGKWLQDSMDNFHRMDETQYQLIDNLMNPPQQIPVTVGGIPRIGPSEVEFRVDGEEAEKISLAYSQSVEESGSPVSTPRLELESDLKEMIAAEDLEVNDEGEQEDGDVNIINFEDISSDISDEDEIVEEEKEKIIPESNNEDELIVDEEGLDKIFVSKFNANLLQMMRKDLDKDFQDNHGVPKEDIEEADEMDVVVETEGDFAYGDLDEFEDDDEGGDY
jgi:hypothetical protein